MPDVVKMSGIFFFAKFFHNDSLEAYSEGKQTFVKNDIE